MSMRRDHVNAKEAHTDGLSMRGKHEDARLLTAGVVAWCRSVKPQTVRNYWPRLELNSVKACLHPMEEPPHWRTIFSVCVIVDKVLQPARCSFIAKQGRISSNHSLTLSLHTHHLFAL